MKRKYSNFTLHSIHILRNQSPSAISEPVNYEIREGNELLWKKGFVYVFQFPNCFLEGMQRCNCFPARTSFLNTSYLFQSHYCNVRFAYIRNPLYIGGTCSVARTEVYRGLERWMNVLSKLNMRWKDDHMCTTTALQKCIRLHPENALPRSR